MRVCILGAGLSSLTLAKTLVNQNIYVDIVTPKRVSTLDKSRTIGISKSNIEFFNSSIINIDKFSWKLKKIEIYTDNLGKEKLINFENRGDQLFSIIKHFKLFQILEKNLSRNKFFKKVNSQKNLNTFKKYNLIINTDFSGPITKKYFSQKIIKEYNSFAYTTIVHHEKIHNDIAIQIFTKMGPLAFLPISETETSIVYSIHNINNKKKVNINNLIDKYNNKYKIKKIENGKFFELKFFNLRSYYHNNILAFGDLLHRIHPLAGQGFNMTIRDIKVISDLIKKKISLGLSLDSSINSEFEKTIRHNNFIFSNGIDLLHEFFKLERKSKNILVSKSIQLLGKNPIINKMLTKIADRGITY